MWWKVNLQCIYSGIIWQYFWALSQLTFWEVRQLFRISFNLVLCSGAARFLAELEKQRQLNRYLAHWAQLKALAAPRSKQSPVDSLFYFTGNITIKITSGGQGDLHTEALSFGVASCRTHLDTLVESKQLNRQRKDLSEEKSPTFFRELKSEKSKQHVSNCSSVEFCSQILKAYHGMQLGLSDRHWLLANRAIHHQRQHYGVPQIVSFSCGPFLHVGEHAFNLCHRGKVLGHLRLSRRASKTLPINFFSACQTYPVETYSWGSLTETGWLMETWKTQTVKANAANYLFFIFSRWVTKSMQPGPLVFFQSSSMASWQIEIQMAIPNGFNSDDSKLDIWLCDHLYQVNQIMGGFYGMCQKETCSMRSIWLNTLMTSVATFAPNLADVNLILESTLIWSKIEVTFPSFLAFCAPLHAFVRLPVGFLLNQHALLWLHKLSGTAALRADGGSPTGHAFDEDHPKRLLKALKRDWNIETSWIQSRFNQDSIWIMLIYFDSILLSLSIHVNLIILMPPCRMGTLAVTAGLRVNQIR